MSKSRERIVILSLGILLDNVTLKPFIDKLTRLAQQDNPKFNPGLIMTAFEIAKKFNVNAIKKEEFPSQLLGTLGITSLSVDDFWNEWNNMITVTSLSKKLNFVKTQDQVVLYSGTNSAHLDKIAATCAEQKVAFNFDEKMHPKKIASLALYDSVSLKKAGPELFEHVVKDVIKNSPPSTAIVVILGKPENMEDPLVRGNTQREQKAITTWCEKEKITVIFHDKQNTLQQTLGNLSLSANSTATMANGLGMNLTVTSITPASPKSAGVVHPKPVDGGSTKPGTAASPLNGAKIKAPMK